MTPEKTTEQAVNEKVGIGAYLSLAFAVVFFSGLCAPQFVQNFPLFTVPQEQVQLASTGRGAPHSGQNLPVETAPQLQVQESPPAAGRIFG